MYSEVPSIPEFEDLKAYIIAEKMGRKAAGGTQCTMRCPYCGDSRDPRNRHLYIGPDKRNNYVLSHHCFLCDAGGPITPKFFRDIDCYEMELIQEVIAYNNSVKRRNKYSKRDAVERRMTFHPIITEVDNMESFDKLKYINDRLGTNLTFADISQNKIILNLNRYLKDNHIGSTTRYPAIMNELSKNCIGFLSVDNSHVIMRTIVDPKTLHHTIARRYNNYAIFTTPNLYLYYVIPGKVDATKPITINIAEGPFDILSVYYNIVQDKTNHIFAAAAGKAQYRGLIKYIFTVIGIPPYLVNIQLYCDSDVDINDLIKLKNDLTKLKVPMTVHKNCMEGEKDFGVPLNRIVDKVLSF